MTEHQEANREEYFRRYAANFIKAQDDFIKFSTWVIVNGVRYEVEITKTDLKHDGDNGFIM